MKVLLVFPFSFSLFSLVINLWTNLVNRMILSDFLKCLLWSNPTWATEMLSFISIQKVALVITTIKDSNPYWIFPSFLKQDKQLLEYWSSQHLSSEIFCLECRPHPHKKGISQMAPSKGNLEICQVFLPLKQIKWLPSHPIQCPLVWTDIHAGAVSPKVI